MLLTIKLKLLIVQEEIKVVNKEAATKRNTSLHDQLTLFMFKQSSVVLMRNGKQKKLRKNEYTHPSHSQRMLYNHGWEKQQNSSLKT